MVRGAGQQRGAHSDESDSDWDSLAQPAIQQQQQQQPAVQLQLPKDVITPPLRKLGNNSSVHILGLEVIYGNISLIITLLA